MTKNLFYLTALIILASCANQTSPSGGPKDTIPPILLKSIPLDQAINVNEQTLVLEFNELVKTNSPKDQIIITPRIEAEYDIKFRKDKVILELSEPLNSNTTYTFFFRDAIQDLTESNPAENLKLAFSTGDFLDSLSISGTITDLFSNLAVKDATVALYTETDTLDIFTGPPLYLTKTNEDGTYLFENLKNDNYYLYSFVDKNRNSTAQSKSEAYGFIPNIVKLDSNVQELDLTTQNLDIRDFELQSNRPTGTVYQIKYNKHVIDYKLFTTDTTYQYFSNFTDDEHHIIQVFNNHTISDSLLTYITSTDSINTTITDTLYIQFPDNQRKPQKLQSSIDLKSLFVSDRKVEGSVTFSKPMPIVNYDSIYIYIDSLHVYPISDVNLQPNQYLDSYNFSYTLDQSLFETDDQTEEEKTAQQTQPTQQTESPDSTDTASTDSTAYTPPPEKPPHIYFGQSSFISIENDSSKSINAGLKFLRPDKLGIIIIEIQTDYESFEIQLLNKQKEVVHSSVNQTSFQINNVKPGEYTLRALIDKDLDGTWNTGNILDRKEPEPIRIYESTDGVREIVIRANWEYPIDTWSF